ncbi:MAG TPA: type I restriction endonuclease [Vicinamibacterales bacterium]|nr:type I restriction endonuclease [Vicinamibacterales bacterium]
MSRDVWTNFAFLQAHDAQLVRLGMLAERYFPDDPNTSILKLRQLTELLAQLVATRVGLYVSPEEAQYDLVRRLQDQGILPREVAQLFGEVRRSGNAASHDVAGDHRTALAALKFTWQLGLWFHRTFGNRDYKSGPFLPPRSPRDESEELRTELERLTQRLVDYQVVHKDTTERLQLTEAQLRSAKDERAFWEGMAAEAEQGKTALANRLAEQQAHAEVQSPAVTAALVTAANDAAHSLELDEAETRQLIDEALRQAGWTADSESLTYAQGARPEKAKNQAIAEWPTSNGPADYVLFAGLTPIAAVEAKRKTKDVSASLQQAKRYSRGFRTSGLAVDAGAQWGEFHLPFVFATNGRPLTGGCTTTVDADHPERATLNGRRIDPRVTYGIALPDRIAESLEIKHSEHDPLFDAITGVEHQFQAYEAAKGNHAPAYPADVRRYGGYWLLSPLQFGYSKVDVRDPGDSKVRPTLPIDFKDAKPTRGFSVKITSDAALVDAPWWAARVLSTLDYQWNKDLTPGAVHPISHDTDEFSTWFRGDWKLHVLQEMRIYGGWSVDGQLSASQRDIQPSFDFTTPEGLDATADAGFKVSVTSPPSHYSGWGFGFDVLPTKGLKLWKGADITLTTGGANVIWGSSSNVLTGVTIAGEAQPTDKLAIAKGLEGIFDDYFDTHRTTFTADTPIDFERQRVHQTRAQFDGSGELHTTIIKPKLTWTPLVRWRQYSKADSSASSPLDLKWTLKLSLGLKVPLWSNLAVEPMVQQDWARIQAPTDNLFSQFKFEIKVDVPLFFKWGRDGFIR